jgi:hypothetical protein
MLYDLSNPLQLNNFIARCEILKKKSCIVELKEKKPIRTLAQNKYLHVCLGYFGALIRDWAVQTAGIYIPSANERDLIIQMEIDIERNKTYL